MRVVFLANTFPEDPVHLRVLTDQLKLTVYGTTFKLTSFTPPPDARTSRGIPTNVGLHTAEPPPDCRTRVFTPLVRVRRGSLFWVYPDLGKALNADAPDVIHVVSEPWGALALQASLWCYRHPETALVIHGADRTGWHGPLPERLGKRVVARAVLNRSDGYAGESARAVELAQRAGLDGSSPTSVIHGNPRDPQLFQPASTNEEKRQARESLGLPADGVGVGFLGRLEPHKGPMLFLDAAQRFQDVDGVWTAIGGIGPLQEEVGRRAEQTGVTNLSGLGFPEQVLAFYRSLDILVVPSKTMEHRDEQAPRAVIEAMMSSCLVVGSDCGSIPDMLGDCGIVVRQDDVDDLARGIAEAVARADDADLRKRSRDRATAEYSGEAVAAKLMHIWGETGTHRPRAGTHRRF